MTPFVRCALAFGILAAFLRSTSVASEPSSIQYKLSQPCRVSLAIYDKDGIQIRTLRNAEQQAAGEHSIPWDGLDQNGKPAAPGTYTWKLLQGQGLKAEYLFSLGVSTREKPWPGNHTGPTALAIDRDGVYLMATAAEGCAQLDKMDHAGKILWAAESFGRNVDDVAEAGGVLYLVSDQANCLFIVNAETGERAWWTLDSKGVITTVATVKRFRFGTDEHAEEGWIAAAPVEYSAARGWGWEKTDGLTGTPDSIRGPAAKAPVAGWRVFRSDVPNNGGWNWYDARVTLRNSEDHPVEVKLAFGIAYNQPIPNRQLTLKPKETITLDLNQLVVNIGSACQFVMGIDGDPGWELQSLEIIAPDDRVAATTPRALPGQTTKPVESRATPAWANTHNEVWVGNTCASCIQQVDPNLNGKVLREVAVPKFQDLAFTRDGQLLVISGNTICVSRDGKLVPVVRDLEDPRRLSVDQVTGDLFVVEWGKHHQIRRYDAAYKLHQTFGREGGRRYGLYHGEDFYRVDDVAGDGHGGFYIVENWGARRTARFDAQGKLVKEWYGGQGFQQYPTQDPQHPDRFWMFGMFNTDVFECEVDWAKRDWHVRAVYNAQGSLEETLGGLLFLPGGFLGGRVHVANKDLGDGKLERLLWLESDSGTLLKIDEANGRLIPLAASGFIQDTEVRMLQTGKPSESESKRFGPLLNAYVAYPKNIATPRYWTWADANGDARMQPEEIRLFTGNWTNGSYVGGFYVAMQLNDDLSVWQRSGWGMPPDGPSYYLMKPDGYTKVGAPIWRFDTREPSVARDRDGALQNRLGDDKGISYEVVSPMGEAYISNGVKSTGGHGAVWPSNLVTGAKLVSRTPDGRVRWSVGTHAPVADADPGQLHAPMRVAGLVKDCVGVAEHVCNPLAVWTTDGLFVGNLLDRRADDGLPGIVYSWFEYKGAPTPGTPRGDLWNRWSLNQYDMVSNGLLGTAPNGDVFYMSTGLNSAPTYRVTGWDELARQQGTVTVSNPVDKHAESGTGLSATYYSKPNFEGDSKHRVDPQIWFGEKSSAVKKPWPLPAITANACSAVWEGFVQPRFTEPGRLLVYLDEGLSGKETPPQRMRLFVNGKLELDFWDHRDFRQIHLPTRLLDWRAGERVAVRLEYSCGKPSDGLSLCWESASVDVEHIPPGSLYPSSDVKVSTQP